MAGGSSTITTGYEYSGGVCQVIAAGPITRLTKIKNGDTIIWEGDVDQSSRNGSGYTALATTLGSAKLYWGLDDETPDPAIAAALVDFGTGPTTVPISSWPFMAKLVIDDCAFGNQPVPPTLVFEFERRLDLLTISAHEIEDDAVLPEVIYDLLTNAIHSLGISTAYINTANFEAACETIITEGIGVSPQLDDTTTLRDFMGTLLKYIDAYLYWDLGQIHIRLIRKGDPSTVVAITESHLTDEPQISGGTFSDTWNFTRLTFSDRENNWDQNAVEPYDDPANASAQGESVPRDIELPFVTRRDVAKLLARRKGIAGGVPQTTVELRLLPSFRDLKPGDLISLTFSKLGFSDKPFRVTSRSTGGSKNSETIIEAVAEFTRDESNDYVPPADPLFNLTSFFDENGSLIDNLAAATPRILAIPAGLRGDDPDGLVCAFEQPASTITRWSMYWTWNPAVKPFKKQTSGKAFPVLANLRGWELFRNKSRWLLRLEFQTQDDADYIKELIDAGQKVYFVSARRLYKATGSTIDEHQIDSMWFIADVNGRSEPLSGLIYDIEVDGGQFGGNDLALETTAGQGNYPALTIYAGRTSDFDIEHWTTHFFERLRGNGSNYWADGMVLNQDTDLIRYFKIVCGNKEDIQDVADVAAVTFDRDDTTMCPDGTFSREWGVAILTLCEQLDRGAFAIAFGGTTPYEDYIADLDQALYAAMFDLQTDDQSLNIEHLDEVLGFLARTGIEFYNTTL